MQVKYTKKLLSLLLVMLMVIAMSAFLTTGAAAADDSVNYHVTLETQVTHANKGDFFEVDVVINSEDADTFGGAIVKIAHRGEISKFDGFMYQCSGEFQTEAYADWTVSYGVSDTAGFELQDGRFVLCTLLFEASGELDDMMTANIWIDYSSVSGLYGNEVGISTSRDYDGIYIDIYDLTVTFGAGEGVDEFEDTAYVKYNEAGLYADPYRSDPSDYVWVVPLEGYVLPEDGKYWMMEGDDDTYYTFDEIAQMTFTESAYFYAVAESNMVTITYPEIITGWDNAYETEDGIMLYNKDYYEGLYFCLDEELLEPGYRYEVWYAVGDEEPVFLESMSDYFYFLDDEFITGDIEFFVYEYVDGFYDENWEYAGAAEGYKVFIYRVNEDNAPTGTILFDGEPMLWSDVFEGYVYMVEDTFDLDDAPEMITFDESGEPNPYVNYDGDVNGMGGVNASDIQVVINIYSGIDNPNIPYTMMMRFAADVNCDGEVDMQDIMAIFERAIAPNAT